MNCSLERRIRRVVVHVTGPDRMARIDLMDSCGPIRKEAAGSRLDHLRYNLKSPKEWRLSAPLLSSDALVAAAAAHQTFALGLLTRQLAGATNRLGLLPGPLLRGFLEEIAHLHFAKDSLTLHFLLEGAESLVDVVVADRYLHWMFRFWRVADVGLNKR